ncbi:MAG: SWIM zinc finger family protein [Actinobacteria bacterium]|nr:SWIM zinc finger family protein [Actinomycetota bacterium]
MSRRYDYYEYYDWYEPSNPKEVKGGIKAQSKRGSFTDKWWGKLWTCTLESFNIGARLSRGRSYARLGQVASLDIDKGSVCAEVQGSCSEAYQISIKLKTFTEKQWHQIIARIIEKPIFAAQLLGNEMPQEIESVFKKAGLSLFPQRQKDLETDCSCPDWSNPCKHIVAVFYLMAEAFDKDPFLLFKLRGMEREEFLNALQDSSATGDVTGDATGEITGEKSKIDPEPLPLDRNGFWEQNSALAMPVSSATPVRLHAALPKRLGSFAFWRSDKNFMDEMERIYKNASGYAESCIISSSDSHD